MTKFEFDVNPFDFGDDTIIENNNGDVLMEDDLEQFMDSEGRNINWCQKFDAMKWKHNWRIFW